MKVCLLRVNVEKAFDFVSYFFIFNILEEFVFRKNSVKNG